MVHTWPVLEPTSTSAEAARPARVGQVLILVAIILLALNLRVAVTSVGVLLPRIRTALGLSALLAGVLTTVPVLAFAVFGGGSRVLTQRIGLHRTAFVALLLVIAGLAGRPFAQTQWSFLALTVVAVAGAALGNVILPPLVKQHFPDRVSLISSVYGAMLVGGASLASATTVPLAQTLGGWRPALGFWTGLGVLALLPWLAVLVTSRGADPSRPARSRAPQETSSHWPLRRIARSRLAWLMAALFAAQSAQAYAQFGWYPAILVDGGLPAGEAASMLAVLTGVAVPLTLVLPLLIRATGGRAALPIGYGVVTMLGWTGVLLAPTTLPWLTALVLGAGSTAFTWVLAMIAQHSSSPTGTIALSGFAQGMGYLLASIGPFGTGALHDLTGSWAPSIIALIALAALIGILGAFLTQAGTIEDDLRSEPGSSPPTRGRKAGRTIGA